MSELIVTEPLAGNSVYGVRQAQYNVGGESGKDFADAIAIAAFKQSTAIEAAAAGYVAVVKARQKKVSELGEVLAHLAQAVAKLPTKDAKSSDRATVDNGAWVNGTASSYGITLVFDANTANMSRSNLWKGQTEVQYQMDKESNNLQQDMVSLQSYITKRDNAYSTAAKIVKKSLNAADSTIRNVGA